MEINTKAISFSSKNISLYAVYYFLRIIYFSLKYPNGKVVLEVSSNETDLVRRGPVIGMLRPPRRSVVVVMMVMVVMVMVLIVVVCHQLHSILGLCRTKTREDSIRS